MKYYRIHMILSTFHPLIGGTETQALLLCRSLRERGYETTIITFLYDRSWPSRDVIQGVPVIRVAGLLLAGRNNLPTTLQRFLYMLALVVMAWTLWKYRRNYDVLHLHQLSVLTLPVAMICRLARKPMIASIRSAGSGKRNHSHTPVSLMAGLLDPAAPWLHIDGASWVDGDLEGLVRIGKPFVRLAHTLLLNMHAIVIILNSRMKDYLADHDFLLPDIHLIPNGVDIARFRPGAENIVNPSRMHTVICVSKLRYEKGIDVLLQAWRLVQHQLPESRLILVGDGPIEKSLKCMAEALGIQESVEFAGLQQDIPAQLHRGSLAVLPSRFEGMPNAILEAMACGLPCVATRVSGSEDVVQHGINGLLVENEDYRGMAQALLLLLQDQELTRKYGSAARETIEKHYSLEHITDRYIEIYQNITDHRHQRARDNSFSPLPVVPIYRGKDTGQCAE